MAIFASLAGALANKRAMRASESEYVHAIIAERMGVDGCWCAPRSSKPVRGVKSLSGEFDPHMLPPEPRGRVPRGFLKNVDFPLDRTEGSSYNTTVRGVSRTTSYPGVAQLVARMVRDHEAVSSNLATRTK